MQFPKEIQHQLCFLSVKGYAQRLIGRQKKVFGKQIPVLKLSQKLFCNFAFEIPVTFPCLFTTLSICHIQISRPACLLNITVQKAASYDYVVRF